MPSESDRAGFATGRRDVLRGAAAAALTWAALRTLPAQANALHLGSAAPEATLTTLDGRTISTKDLRGHVVILTFWATWCTPCRDELPLLSRYAERHSAEGLRVLGFSLDSPDQIGDVRRVAQSLRFPVGLLSQSSAPGYGRIWRLPVNFTIDREGRLANNGWKEKKPAWTAERLDQIVTPLLNAAG